MRPLTAGLLLLLSVFASACVTEADRSDGRFEDEAAARNVEDVKASNPKEPSPGGSDAPSTPGEAEPSTSEPPRGVTTCDAPRDLGAIAGDADGASVSAQGTCSEWLRINVTEMSTGPLANAMKLKATLVSSPEADFDLYAYVDKEANVVACTKEEGKSELPASRSDLVNLEWGEQYTANNADDQRPVTIEVRAKDPASCGKGRWVLLLEGNR